VVGGLPGWCLNLRLLTVTGSGRRRNPVSANTVLAEDALGGPAALRGTPMQAVTGTAVRLINIPVTWSAHGLDRAIDTARTSTGILELNELPIGDYDELTVPQAVAAVKDLTDPADVRAIVAYEEAHKRRHGVISAAQTRLAAVAQEAVGID